MVRARHPGLRSLFSRGRVEPGWSATAQREQQHNPHGVECGRWYGGAAVVRSPDGRRLASCSEDRTVRVWRAEDGMLLQTLVGHTRSVAGIAWSPDGRKFASCGGGGAAGEIFLWDAESGQRVASFTGHA